MPPAGELATTSPGLQPHARWRSLTTRPPSPGDGKVAAGGRAGHHQHPAATCTWPPAARTQSPAAVPFGLKGRRRPRPAGSHQPPAVTSTWPPADRHQHPDAISGKRQGGRRRQPAALHQHLAATSTWLAAGRHQHPATTGTWPLSSVDGNVVVSGRRPGATSTQLSPCDCRRTGRPL